MRQNYTTVKNTYEVPDDAQALIRTYLQGLIYSWCNTNGAGAETRFQARTFHCGDSFFWQRTPMMALYTYYLEQSNQDENYAFEEAGKAAGRIMKQVLHEDKRKFVQVAGRTASYYWNGKYVEGQM